VPVVPSNSLFFRVEVEDVDSDGDGLSDWDELQLEGYDPYNPQSFQSGISDLASFSFALSNGSLVASIAMDRVRILALANLTTPPTVQSADGFPPQDGMQAIFYDALPWKGNPTKVFAWLGLPKNRTGKVPAVVLVHGGGGTAYTSWVKKWNEQGFAAISIAGLFLSRGRKPWYPHFGG
jgi:hypothetical protein